MVGAAVKDALGGGREVEVHARQVINATGPFADGVRRMSDPGAAPMIMPSSGERVVRGFEWVGASGRPGWRHANHFQHAAPRTPAKPLTPHKKHSGVHVTLPDYYSPEKTGLIVPKTADGRVVFLLPWHDATIAGTTDAPVEVGRDAPLAHEDEIAFILGAIKDYLTVEVRRSDVQSAWSGVRPLAADPTASDTASASRDHVVAVEPDGLLTVAGGKWTTYRLMAEDAIDAAVAAGKLDAARPCRTARLPLVGAVGYTPGLFTEVAQNYTVPHRPGAIDTRVAKHLAAAYGDRARAVTRLAEERGLGRRLTRGHPELEAEVVYAAHHEWCETAEDFIARRTRMAFVDVAATEQALPRVVELLAQEKGWGVWRRRRETARTKKFLASFNGVPSLAKPAPPAAAKASPAVAAGVGASAAAAAA